MFYLITLFSAITLITGMVSYHYLVTGWHDLTAILEERKRRRKDRAYLKLLRAL